MTVTELIEELKKLPQDLEVIVLDSDSDEGPPEPQLQRSQVRKRLDGSTYLYPLTDRVVL